MKTIEDIIPKLMEKTNGGSISWKELDIREKYSAGLGNFEIDTWKWEDEDDGTKGISVGLRKKSSHEYADVVYFDKYSSKYERLRELHAAARRSALSVDKMLDEIESTLDDLPDVFG